MRLVYVRWRGQSRLPFDQDQKLEGRELAMVQDVSLSVSSNLLSAFIEGCVLMEEVEGRQKEVKIGSIY